MESPILSAREDGIRWSPDVDIPHEGLLPAPPVIAERVDTQGKIQVETHARPTGFLRKVAHLLMGEPLRIEMKADVFLTIVVGP